MAVEKKTKTDKKVKDLKIREAIELVNLSKKINLLKIDRSVQVSILRVAYQLKPAVARFEEFQKDTIERLKPENFEDIAEKQKCFDTLPDEEKIALNKVFSEYDKAVTDVVSSELDKTVTLDLSDIEAIDFDALAQIGSNNEIPAYHLLPLMDATA